MVVSDHVPFANLLYIHFLVTSMPLCTCAESLHAYIDTKYAVPDTRYVHNIYT